MRVFTAQGKQGKWLKNSLSGKTQGIWKFCQNTGILFAQFLLEARYVCQVSFVFGIVTNHVNRHRENLQLDKENREFENAILLGTLEILPKHREYGRFVISQ